MKLNTQNITPNKLLIVLLSIWTILNTIQAYVLGLSDNEAYYWVISQTIQWGYYDTPPLFIWIINLSTTLFGDTELGIRVLFILILPISLFILWETIKSLKQNKKPTKKNAITFFLIAFAIPLLQFYGGFANQLTILIFATTITIWAYQQLIRTSKNQTTINSLINIAALTIGFAMLLYSSYLGALIIILLVSSNIANRHKQLKQPQYTIIKDYRFWLALLTAVALYTPHMLWLINNDIIALEKFFSTTNNGFQLKNIINLIIKLIAIFNPLLLPIVLILAYKKKRGNIILNQQYDLERVMKYFMWGVLGFFLCRSFQTEIKIEMVSVVCLPIIYFLFKNAVIKPIFRKYIFKIGCFSLVLFMVYRTTLLCCDEFLTTYSFYNHNQYFNLSKQLRGVPLLTDDHFVASKLQYYGASTSFCRESIHSSISHYDLFYDDRFLLSKPVFMKLSDAAINSSTKKELLNKYERVKIGSINLFYGLNSNYIPVSQVEVSTVLAEKIIAGQSNHIYITIQNPYNHDIPLGEKGFNVYLQLIGENDVAHQFLIRTEDRVIKARETITIFHNLQFHKEINTQRYTYFFSLVRPPFFGTVNSEKRHIYIINPREV